MTDLIAFISRCRIISIDILHEKLCIFFDVNSKNNKIGVFESKFNFVKNESVDELIISHRLTQQKGIIPCHQGRS